MTGVDIKLEKNAGGVYDISFENGDFTKVDGFETALQMSLLVNKRADASEVPRPELREGWWGNTLNDVEDYQIGSKLWLLKQAKLNTTTLNEAIDFANDGLQWFLEDNLLENVIVDGTATSENITLSIDLVRSQNIVLSRLFQLWDDTQDF